MCWNSKGPFDLFRFTFDLADAEIECLFIILFVIVII